MYWGSGGKDSVLLLGQLGKEYSDLAEITTSRRFQENRIGSSKDSGYYKYLYSLY